MAITRYILMGTSAFMALFLLLFWTVSGKASDIALFIGLAFLLANTFYIFFTRPTLKTSDMIKKASTGLALASIELQYRAQEAQSREVEAEQQYLAEAEEYQYKLQVAREMLQHFGVKVPLTLRKEKNIRQISQQVETKDVALPKPLPAAEAAEKVVPAKGQDAAAKPVPPIGPMRLAPSTTTLN